jgi:5-methylcytosine-specific restriction endonuclease McrA
MESNFIPTPKPTKKKKGAVKNPLFIPKICDNCGSLNNLHMHHVFGAANRKHSEKYGLKVYLCMECHTGSNGIHFNRPMDLWYKARFQSKFEEQYGHEEFMKIFQRNYLD